MFQMRNQIRKTYHNYHLSPESIVASRESTKAAVERAPDHAMALAMQAYALSQGVFMAMERREDVDVEATLDLAERSVYHGASTDFVYRNRGRIRLWLCGDYDACRADAKRSLAINPGYHMALEDLAMADVFGGKPHEGIPQLEALLSSGEIEPLHTAFRHSMLAIAHILCDEVGKAIEHAREGYEQSPFLPLHAIAFAIAAGARKELTASSEFQEMLRRHDLHVSDASRFPFSSSEDEEKIADLLRQAGLPD